MKNQPSYFVGAAVAALVLAGCATMPAVKKISGEPAAGTIGYFLPKTQLIAAVPLKQTVLSKPALLPKELEDQKEYLRLLADELKITADEVQIEDQVLYSIVSKDIALTTRGVRDEAARFEAALTAGPLSDLSLTLEFSDEQFMESASADVTNQALPIALKAATTAATIIWMPLAKSTHESTKPPESKQLVIETSVKWKNATKEIIKQIQAFDEQATAYIAKPQSMVGADQIKQALELIRAKREALRLKLTGGTAKETVWIMEAKFSPTPEKQTVELGTLYEVAGFEAGVPAAPATGAARAAKPEPQINNGLCPFAFNAEKKAQPISEWKEDKKTGNLIWEARAPTETRLTLTLTEIEPTVERTEALLGDEGSYVYRMPGRALARISGGDSQWLEKEIVVAQFGQLRQLPRELGGVHGAYTITLDGQTGALKKIVATSTAADISKSIEAVGDIAKTQHDAKKAKRDEAKAEAAANSPEAKRAAERADLENQKAIRDLRIDLGQTNPSGGQN